MTVFIGFFGAILGTVVGALATFLTSRSNMRLTLEHQHDQTLQNKRLERYQELFHVTECLPRYRPPNVNEPNRDDLVRYLQEFHLWYFGEAAGGMFLTTAAKEIYSRLLNLLAETAFKRDSTDSATAVSADELLALRDLAGELRYQLVQDVGAAHPPRLSWARPNPAPLPAINR